MATPSNCTEILVHNNGLIYLLKGREVKRESLSIMQIFVAIKYMMSNAFTISIIH